MSLSGSMSTALSGLAAASRSAEVVASNIANARTAGYAQREVALMSRGGAASGGVTVVGVTRNVDAILVSDRRIAEAGASADTVRADFLKRLESALGDPDTDGSLASRIGALQTALTAATARPESDTHLATAIVSAQGLARLINDASQTVQDARGSADRAIAADVRLLNETLSGVAEMNSAIRAALARDRDASGLMDQRQQLIDRIAGVVPLREVDRGMGEVALISSGGAILLDGRPARFGFTPVATVVPGMTIGGGLLSGLTLNDRPMPTSGAGSLLGEGRLAANFALRDQIAPDAQAQLDALARDLVERFSAPSTDPTLLPGSAGLFTDAGGPADPATEIGLASRLRVNTAVDPDSGGALWRLRDGIGAATPGNIGSGERLAALSDALTTQRIPASGMFTTGSRSVSGLAGDLLSAVSSARLSAEKEASFATAKAFALGQSERERGVDTDREMQQLLVIERAYGANAKVIQTVDRMLETLLGI